MVLSQDGEVGVFRRRNKWNKQTNTGSAWVLVSGPISWRNAYFETETLGYSRRRKKWEQLNNQINSLGQGDRSVGEELSVQA
jgi:hypothetical protein